MVRVVYGVEFINAHGKQRTDWERRTHMQEQLQLERLARKAGRGMYAHYPERMRSEGLQLMEAGAKPGAWRPRT